VIQLFYLEYFTTANKENTKDLAMTGESQGKVESKFVETKGILRLQALDLLVHFYLSPLWISYSPQGKSFFMVHFSCIHSALYRRKTIFSFKGPCRTRHRQPPPHMCKAYCLTSDMQALFGQLTEIANS